MRFLSTAVVSLLLAAPASAQEARLPIWARGPAGGAFGLFIDGGATTGVYGFESFAAASLGLGLNLRWFEASATGHYGGSFDSLYGGGAFLVRLAARVPLEYVAVSFGASLGYVAVPGHLVSGFAVEPASLGLEFDPFCHFRIGLLVALGHVFAKAPQDALRVELTFGYATGRCSTVR